MGDAHTLSLPVHISALLLSELNTLFFWELSHLLLCYISNNKLPQGRLSRPCHRAHSRVFLQVLFFPMNVLLFSLLSASESEFLLVQTGKDWKFRPYLLGSVVQQLGLLGSLWKVSLPATAHCCVCPKS